MDFSLTGFWLSIGLMSGVPILLGTIAPMDTKNPKDTEDRRKEFEEQALPHLNLLYNMALRFTRNPDDASDLVQDTYLRAYRFFYQFERGTNIRAWLLKILRNTFINQYRKKVSEPRKVGYEEIEPYFERVAKNNTAEMIKAVELDVFGHMLGDEMTSALEKLPEEFKTAVVLCDVEDLSYDEIAEIMDCPTGTVRSRISRGRKMLQTHLWDYAKEQGFVKD
jgi:RNA polymerase sigma-70 factor, ECF subfamily